MLYLILTGLWLAFGYIAARMMILDFEEVEGLTYIFFAFGLVGYIIVGVNVALAGKWSDIRRAHFIPKIPWPHIRTHIPKPNKKLQAKFFGIKLDD